MAMSFNFVLSNNTANGYCTTAESDTDSGLLSGVNVQDSNILTATGDYNSACVDAFGGKDLFGTCDISNASEAFVVDGTAETAGSVACNSVETMGSVACNSAETAGSVACGSDSGSSGGGGSFSSFC